MTGTIADPAQFQQIRDEIEAQVGIVLPDDSCDATLVRDLLTGCKTASATRRMLAAEQAAERQGKNPDSPGEDDDYAVTHQFSTEGRQRRAAPRLDDAEVAKKIVDRQEAYLKSPNFRRPAY